MSDQHAEQQREPTPKQPRGRPFPPGVSGNPSGRRPGPGRRTLASMLAAAGMSPIEYLLSVMTDDTASRRDRVEAAKCLLPYTHRKLPEQVTTFDPPFTLQSEADDDFVSF